jgi:hypothetical protein
MLADRLAELRRMYGWPNFPTNPPLRQQVAEELEEMLEAGHRVPAVLEPLERIYRFNGDLKSALEVAEIHEEVDSNPRTRSATRALRRRIADPSGWAERQRRESSRLGARASSEQLRG